MGVGAGVLSTRFRTVINSQNFTSAYNGEIAEVILYNDWTNVHQQVYDYLDEKYSIAGSYPTGGEKLASPGDYYNDEIELMDGDIDIEGIRPNPTSDFAQFGFRVAEAQNIIIELYDNMGRMIETVRQGIFQQNMRHEIVIDCNKLTPGIYIYKIIGVSFAEYGKLIVVR